MDSIWHDHFRSEVRRIPRYLKGLVDKYFMKEKIRLLYGSVLCTSCPFTIMGLFYVLTIKGLFYVHETPIL